MDDATKPQRHSRDLPARQAALDPIELDVYRSVVAERHGRPLRVMDMPDIGGRAGPSWMWLATDATDILLLNNSASAKDRDCIDFHRPPWVPGADLASSDWLDMYQLLPDLDPAVVDRVLAQTDLSERQR